MIYDIRGNKEEEITGIKFDNSDDILIVDSGVLVLKRDERELEEVNLVTWKDFDNFIAACHKARELWGPKE